MIVEVQATLERLLHQEDTDGDGCITVRDQGPKVFELRCLGGQSVQVRGTYSLANLLQELGWAAADGRARLDFGEIDLEEVASRRISRLIRERYWKGLTRSVSGDSLEAMLSDPKGDGVPRLFIPADDPESMEFHASLGSEVELELRSLPSPISPEYVLSLNLTPGLLGLATRKGVALPYVVPGGRFNEMYGWDSYFIILGLLQDGYAELARSMVEHMVYQIEHYGAVLNANRTYYLTRSQPPFLPTLIGLFPQAKTAWRERAVRAAVREYDLVWTGPLRRRDCGLSRYFDAGEGYPPETLIRHYAQILRPFADRLGLSVEEYRLAYLARRVAPPELDRYFKEDRAVRESGHDSSYRLEDRCTRLCTVDLNSLLFRFETDLANLLNEHFGGGLEGVPPAPEWLRRAAIRQEVMNRLCWRNDGFHDFDWSRDRVSIYHSATNYYPLWAGLATGEQAARMVESLQGLIEPGGVASSTEESRGPLSAERTARQWDFPFGWAPHQMLIWEGLNRYGYRSEASELALRWLSMMTRIARDYNGILVEKYDVHRQTHLTHAEYPNQGSQVRHFPTEGFGWTNASFQVGLTHLSPTQRRRLEEL